MLSRFLSSVVAGALVYGFTRLNGLPMIEGLMLCWPVGIALGLAWLWIDGPMGTKK